jgi:hypothetical protein
VRVVIETGQAVVMSYEVFVTADDIAKLIRALESIRGGNAG